MRKLIFAVALAASLIAAPLAAAPIVIKFSHVVAENTIPVVRTLNFHSEKSAVSAIIAQ